MTSCFLSQAIEVFTSTKYPATLRNRPWRSMHPKTCFGGK